MSRRHLLKTSVGLTILFAMATTLAAQSFEVASIKPVEPPGGGRKTSATRIGFKGGPGTGDPGLYSCLCALTMLVTQAYDLQPYQLTAPDWINGVWFELSAKVPDGATKEQLRVMLRNLLGDRFKLTIHRDQKEFASYQLVIAKSGPKLKETAEKSNVASSDPQPQSSDGDPGLDKDGFVVRPPGYVWPKGRIEIARGGKARIRGDGETMQDLADRVSGVVHKPVKDMTGLKGKYDYMLTFDARVLEGRGFEPSRGPVDVSTPLGGAEREPATPFEAEIQSQLGLKLESKKGQIEVIVVDHVEKVPTEN